MTQSSKPLFRERLNDMYSPMDTRDWLLFMSGIVGGITFGLYWAWVLQ